MTQECQFAIQFSSPIWVYTYFAKRNTFHLEGGSSWLLSWFAFTFCRQRILLSRKYCNYSRPLLCFLFPRNIKHINLLKLLDLFCQAFLMYPFFSWLWMYFLIFVVKASWSFMILWNNQGGGLLCFKVHFANSWNGVWYKPHCFSVRFNRFILYSMFTFSEMQNHQGGKFLNYETFF